MNRFIFCTLILEIRRWLPFGIKWNVASHLGEVGATGYNIINPHLHLETRIGPAEGEFSDGMAYYDTRTTEAERSNYELWRTSGEFTPF